MNDKELNNENVSSQDSLDRFEPKNKGININSENLLKRIPDKGIKENFFSTKGRINRKRYIKRLLAICISILLMRVILANSSINSIYIISLVNLLAFRAFYCINIRREHDISKNQDGKENLKSDSFSKIIVLITLMLIFEVIFEFKRVVSGEFNSFIYFYLVLTGGITLYLLMKKGYPKSNIYGPSPLD